MEKFYDFDSSKGYKLVSVTDKEGNDKSQERGLYQERIQCIATDVHYVPCFEREDLFMLHLLFVKGPENQWIRRTLRTSRVERTEVTENGVKVYTLYSIYEFEHADIVKPELQDAANLIELYLSMVEDYNFAKGFYYDGNKNAHELEEHVHVGMFTDTILLGTGEDNIYGHYICRYYDSPNYVEFYDVIPQTTMLIHNVGPCDLQIKFQNRKKTWTIQPGESECINLFRPDEVNKE